MTSLRRPLVVLVAATCAASAALPVTIAAASAVPAATVPGAVSLPVPTFPVAGLPAFGTPLGGVAVGGDQIGQAGCVGTNRPSLGGNAGSTSAQTCGAVLSFNGPQIGQIATVIGPTIIGSVIQAPIQESAAPITNTAS